MKAKEMFENIEMFGVKGHYYLLGEEDQDPTIEWVTKYVRGFLSFDLKGKDFQHFIMVKGLYMVPLNIDKELFLAIQQQMKELNWI